MLFNDALKTTFNKNKNCLFFVSKLVLHAANKYMNKTFYCMVKYTNEITLVDLLLVYWGPSNNQISLKYFCAVPQSKNSSNLFTNPTGFAFAFWVWQNQYLIWLGLSAPSWTTTKLACKGKLSVSLPTLVNNNQLPLPTNNIIYMCMSVCFCVYVCILYNL